MTDQPILFDVPAEAQLGEVAMSEIAERIKAAFALPLRIERHLSVGQTGIWENDNPCFIVEVGGRVAEVNPTPRGFYPQFKVLVMPVERAELIAEAVNTYAEREASLDAANARADAEHARAERLVAYARHVRTVLEQTEIVSGGFLLCSGDFDWLMQGSLALQESGDLGEEKT